MRAGRLVGGRYRLVRRLAPDGIDDLWLATHTQLCVPVVVKFLSHRTGDDAPARRRALARFRLESRLGALFAEHTRNVVVVHDAGDDEGLPYLVMEYVRGRSLQAEVRYGSLHPVSFARILDQTCAALEVIHECGFVHKNLTPASILLTALPDGSFDAKLADFGATRAAGRIRETLLDGEHDEVGGTPGYMSPEQLFGATIDARTDVWALGVIAYRALTGKAPFGGPGIVECVQDIVTRRLDPSVALRANLPRAIGGWFERALAKPRADRFGSAREMSRAFTAAIHSENGGSMDRAIEAASDAAAAETGDPSATRCGGRWR